MTDQLIIEDLQPGDGKAVVKGALITTQYRGWLADGSEFDQTGLLTAAEPFVNETTGVVTLRLSIPNPDRVLLPGQVDKSLRHM